MPDGRGVRKASMAAAALVCIALTVPIQTKIDNLRADLVKEAVLPQALPHSAAASAALGGFRGVAVDLLWIQADSMINERQFHQLRMYYELIAILQPNFPSVWTYNAWNLAFNISAEWNQPDDKWLWIREGIHFAREGLEYNPESDELNNYIGFLYFIKVGKDPYFAKRLEEEEQLQAYYEAYKYFKRATEIALKRGDFDVRYAGAAMQALHMHSRAVLSRTGNVPETLRILDEVEAGTRTLVAQFPDDPAVVELLGRIERDKARLSR